MHTRMHAHTHAHALPHTHTAMRTYPPTLTQLPRRAHTFTGVRKADAVAYHIVESRSGKSRYATYRIVCARTLGTLSPVCMGADNVAFLTSSTSTS